MPFKINSGATRISLRAEFAAPGPSGSNWQFAVGGGLIVLDPLPAGEDDGLLLKRVLVRGTIDPVRQRVTFDQGDFGTKEFGGRDLNDVSIALSGSFDFGGEPRLALGIAGNQMPVAALKRLWPVFIAPKVRDWVVQHIISGTVERVEIAANMTVAAMQPTGPPVPDDGLSIDIAVKNVMMRPVEGLPPIKRGRPDGADHRAHRDGIGRQGHRRRFAGTPAQSRQRRVRGAGHASQGAAGARAVPPRRAGARGRRTGCARPA